MDSINQISANPLAAAFNEKVDVNEPFGLCHAGYSASDKEYDLLDDLGNNWLRVDFSWVAIEREVGVWNYSYYDTYVQKANERGQKILAILDYGHPKLGHNSNFYISPAQIPYYLEYVNQTVNRYRTNITAFEIWNEPNHVGFWGGTQTEFFELFNQAAELIYNIDPNIKIAGPAMAGHDPRYIEQMFQLGVTRRLHAISFHPYSTHPDSIYQRIYEIQQVMAKYDFKGELWITEVGNPTGGTYGYSSTLKGQADKMIKTFVHSTVLGVQNIVWYTLFDPSEKSQQNDPLNSENFFGIVKNPSESVDYQYKPGAYAFKAFANHIANSAYYPNAIAKKGVFNTAIRAFLYRNANGCTSIIAWADESLAAHQEVTIKISIPKNASAINLHDIYTGEQQTLGTDRLLSFSLGNAPVMLSYLTDPDNFEVIILELVSPMGWIAYAFLTPFLLAVVLIAKFHHGHSTQK
jgi:hypothetical protein